MSQAGEIDVVGNHPEIPTEFIANTGTAVPIANTLEILGNYTAADSVPVQTTGSGNTITTLVQLSQAIAASDVTKVGLAAFDSSDFAVDANGFVTLSGSGSGQTITGDSGGALNPTLGNWNIFGATVAAGSTPLATSGSGSTLTINAQRSQAIAASDATKVGLSNFNSAQFTVDANGFVSFSGSGAAETLTGNSGVATPVANNINVITANSTVKFVGSGSTLTQDFGLTNLMLGSASAGVTTAARNVGVGLTNLNPITSGTDNTAVGFNALKSVTTASLNTAVGSLSQQNITIGATANTSIGYASLSACTSGDTNTALGYSSLTSLTTGIRNIAVGHGAGGVLSLSDSNNIIIGHAGISGDNNRIRIGTQGSGIGQQNTCYIAGIVGVTVSNTQMVTIDSTTGQLGVTAVPVTGVSSVSGTTNRITASPTTGAVAVDISASYVGQSSITTLGTITTGVWNGTAVDATHGGTNQTTWATGDLLYASGVNTLAKLAAGSNTQILTLAGGVPTWAPPATSGTVTSVSGTLNRITSTGGATPVIDISASYVGQSSITTLGTITTGTWNGTAVDVAHGGTGRTTLTNHGVLVGAGTTAITQLAAGSAGQVLQSGGASADPAYSTPTYPSASGSTGVILRSDGTNNVYTTATYPDTTTSQQILYSTSNNVIGQLTTANSKFPATNSSGTLAMRGLSVVVQVFAASGTYTPTSGMLYAMIEVVGSGGGSGGVATTSGTTSGYAAGGGGGEYARGIFTAATIGASQTVTINNGGTAATAGNNPGGTGGTNSVGALITAVGGGGGAGSAAAATGSGVSNLGGIGGTGGSGGDFRFPGNPGGNGIASFGLFGTSGAGGTSYFSGGARGLVASAVGDAGQLYGGGASGSVGFNVAARAGAAGGKGIVVITEYVIA